MEEFQFGLRSNTAATSASTALHEQVAAALVLPLLHVFCVLSLSKREGYSRMLEYSLKF